MEPCTDTAERWADGDQLPPSPHKGRGGRPVHIHARLALFSTSVSLQRLCVQPGSLGRTCLPVHSAHSEATSDSNRPACHLCPHTSATCFLSMCRLLILDKLCVLLSVSLPSFSSVRMGLFLSPQSCVPVPGTAPGMWRMLCLGMTVVGCALLEGMGGELQVSSVGSLPWYVRVRAQGPWAGHLQFLL